MWLGFWIAVIIRRDKGDSVHQILQNPGFFRTVAVMGVIAATVVLSLAGKLAWTLGKIDPSRTRRL
jgi:5'(3')-deoxyribonucleotidase